MLAVSAQVHHAQDIGQMTMFDLLGGEQRVRSDIVLPGDAVPVSNREKLNWEKELVGFYVSEHPLHQVAADLRDQISCFCGEINEEMDGQYVTVAGVVDWVRPHVTKKGEQMAFVHIEDIQGSIELVVFPSVYRASRELLQQDKILVVRGKVDAGRGEPKVLCESVQNYVTIARPIVEATEVATAIEEEPPPRVHGDRNYRPEKPAPRHLQITIHRTADPEQDRELVRQAYRRLQDHTGDDQFTFWVVNGDYRVQIDFPDATTAYTPELAASLAEMLGQDALQLT
jgi:DNA polymerase-3 subunit alpha